MARIISKQDKFLSNKLVKASIGLVFLAVVAVTTMAFSTQGHAASTVYHGVEIETAAGHVDTLSGQNPDAVTTTDTVEDTGGQTVAVLNQGQSFTLTATHGGGGWHDVTDCYLLQAPDSTVTATITAVNNSKEVTVTPHLPFSSECVGAKGKGQAYNLNVTNDSDATLYLYEVLVNQVCTVAC